MVIRFQIDFYSGLAGLLTSKIIFVDKINTCIYDDSAEEDKRGKAALVKIKLEEVKSQKYPIKEMGIMRIMIKGCQRDSNRIAQMK